MSPKLLLLLPRRLSTQTILRCMSTASSPPPITTRILEAPHRGHIKILSLNRPQARNAISRQLLQQLSHEIEILHSEPADGPTRALIIASSVDSAFCAGADLKERATFTQQDTSEFLASLRRTFSRIEELPIPTLTALHAPAFGGGLELALTTNLRLFASTATVALPETRLGILPGAGGTHRLPSIIGLPRARDLILTGRRVAAPEAYFIGICDRLVEIKQGEEKGAMERVLEESISLAMEICEGGPIAIRQALKAVNGWKRGQEAENEAYENVVNTDDKREALLAFKEKRKPVFTGR